MDTPGKGKTRMATEKTEAAIKNVTMERKGKQIILPEDMTLDQTALWIQRKREEEQKALNFFEEFTGVYPLDAHSWPLLILYLSHARCAVPVRTGSPNALR
jgi:hypothetical protein